MQIFEDQTLDIFQPLRDPNLPDTFPPGELPDISILDTSPFNLDYFNLDTLDDIDWPTNTESWMQPPC